jgi:histidine ammonia-lyase
LLAVLVLRVVLLLRVVSLVLTQVQSRLIHMLEEMLLRQVAPAVPVVQRVMVERVVLVLLAFLFA